MQGMLVRSLVGELRSHTAWGQIPHGMGQLGPCATTETWINKWMKRFLNFRESICYQLYSNESGRNYCLPYNIDKKMVAYKVKFIFRVSTENKWHEPWFELWQPNSKTCTWISPGNSELLQPDSPPSPSCLSAVPTGSPQPAHLPLGLCPPTCL